MTIARYALILTLSCPVNAAVEDWNCRALSQFAGYVAVDRDNGVEASERIERTYRAVVLSTDELDPKEFSLLFEVVKEVYASPLSPVDVRRGIFRSCVGNRPRPLGSGV